MRGTRLAAIPAAVLAIALTGVVAAQQEDAAEAVQVVKVPVPVKSYKTLDAADVYRAAIDGRQADVRFRDAFEGRATVPEAVRRLTVRGVEYFAVAAFRTQSELVCLVPGDAEQALRALFGVPEDWPLTPEVLSTRMALNADQQLTVEGTVAGTALGEKYVLADAVLLDGDPRPPVQRDLLVFPPGAAEPDIISEPGRYTLTYPCSYVPQENFDVTVSVRAMGADTLMAELARVAAAYEGMANARKDYGIYAAGVVYRYARDSRGINVDFTDAVSQVIGYSVPADIATAPALRAGQLVRVPVGHAFGTTSGVTCLIPADRPTLMTRAASVLPAENVRIRGTVIGNQGAYQTVLVDYIGFPEQEGAPGGDQTWLVSVEWPGIQPRVFWDYGRYVLPDLPCQHAEGRFEVLQVVLRQFRLVEVPVVAEEAEAAKEEPEGE